MVEAGGGPAGAGDSAARDDEAARRRRARARIDSRVEPTGPLPEPGARRLSDRERAALRERVRSRSADPPEPAPVSAAVPAPVEGPAPGPTALRRTTTKPPPAMPRPDGETTVRSRGMVALGTLLIVGLTILAFAGGRLFGSPPQPPPPPTPRAALAADALVVAVAPASPEATPLLAAAGAEPTPAATAERRPIVCLDPGHGGRDRGFSRGAIDVLPPMEEATLALEHAWDLESSLLQRGFEVVMTRRTDAAVAAAAADVNGDGRTTADDVPGNSRYGTLDDLQARIDTCNAAGADLLVSMHVNGYTTQNPRGVETWFTREREFGDRNAAFATLAYAHLKEQLRAVGYAVPPEEERGVNPDTAANVAMEYSLFKHFIITGPAVPGAVDPSAMPGAIVEALFVSNDGDAAMLASPEGRNAIATAYENAIVEYFDWFPPES